MPDITIRGSKKIRIFAEFGETCADVIKRAGLTVDMPCGKNGKCGKCKIQAYGALSAPDEIEKALLKGAPRSTRLACRAKIAGDCVIYTSFDSISAVTGFKNSMPPADEKGYGIACDIGTTTVALYLLDMGKAEIISSISFNNPQRAFGSDVISRIKSSSEGEDLKTPLIEKLFENMNKICLGAGLSLDKVNRFSIVGNTAMLYILTGIDTACLGKAPFSISEKYGKTLKANTVLPFANSDALLHIPPCVGAFIGADVVAGSVICMKNTPALYIDLGTNAEIALKNDNNYIFTSAAAGPAFEGVNITCGCPAVEGAVYSVSIEDEVLYKTISDKKPVGICGAGIISLIAELLKTGICDRNGRLLPKNLVYEKYRKFMGETENGLPAFFIDENIYLTSVDVREILLAKAALAASIEILLDSSRIPKADIGKVYIAGGFGQNISLEDIFYSGILPIEFSTKCEKVGNAAGLAAISVLLNEKIRKGINGAANNYFLLDMQEKFNDIFIKCMHFTNTEN